MLGKFKKNITRRNLLTWIIFGSIILVFVFFGYQGDKGGAGYAARVNEELISVKDFQNAVENMSKYKFLFGQGPEADKAVQNNALNQLIDLELISQGAQKSGFRIPDTEIADTIVTNPGFQENGKFQRANYERYLQYDSNFEKRLKKQLLYQKFMKTIEGSFVASDLEIEKAKQLRSNQVNLEFLKLDFKSLKEPKINEQDFKTQITDILALYSSNKKEEAVRKANDLGLKWEETGLFSLDAQDVPKVGKNNKLMADAFSLKDKGQLGETPYDAMGIQYFVRLKEKKVTETKDLDAPETAERVVTQSKVNGVLESLKKEFKQTSHVSVNPMIMKMVE